MPASVARASRATAARAGTGLDTGVVIVSPDYWPLPWYLRDYPRAGFFGTIAGMLYAYYTQFVSPSNAVFATSGKGVLMAILGGLDMLDTAMSPLAGGTSHPATESMVASLQGTPYDTGLALESFLPITQHFRTVRRR